MAVRQTRNSVAGRTLGTPGAGLPVDKYGAGAIDPTENVLALVAALAETQKLLRAADTLRQDDLRDAETRRQDDLRIQRNEFEKRIDVLTSTFQNQMAVVLATQTDKSANLLASTVDKLSTATNERLAAVEKNQYVTGGKTSVSDPATFDALRELTASIKPLTATKDTATGMAQMLGWIMAGIMAVIMAVIALIIPFVMRVR